MELQNLWLVCIRGNIVFLRPTAFAHSLFVVSKIDRDGGEIFLVLGKLYFGEKTIKHKEKEIFRISFFRFDYALDFSA